MIESVGWNFKWRPEHIGRLFVDAIDYDGLEYWYNVCDKAIPKIEKK